MKEKIEYGTVYQLATIFEDKFRQLDWDWVKFAEWTENTDFEQRHL